MTQEQWARALLGRLGYKTSKANLTAILAWMRAEGGHWNNSAHYNPLNTTQGMSGATSMNSVGVKAYKSWEQGLQATVITLRNGFYGRILSQLKTGTSAQGVASAVTSSPWGTKRISLSGLTVTGGGGGGGAVHGSGIVALDRDELAEQYGLTSRLINSSKELKSLFNQAVNGGWSAVRFQAKLKNTKWWRTQSSTLRKYITTKITDPATHEQRWNNTRYKINQLAVEVGMPSQINPKGKSSKYLIDATWYALAQGWSDERIKDWFALRVHTGSIMSGEVGEMADKLHEIAYLNGMKYHTWYGTEARNIVAGRSTLQKAEANVRRQAAAKYSAWADQIVAGQNVMDLAAPYIKTVSQLLELPDSDVDLFNSHVNRAMTAKGDAKGAQYPLWQLENDVRNDPLWKKTNNARESLFTAARQVAKDFGVGY